MNPRQEIKTIEQLRAKFAKPYAERFNLDARLVPIRLKRLRELNGFTQAQLGQLLAGHRSRASRAESDTPPKTLAPLLVYCAFYGVSPGEFFRPTPRWEMALGPDCQPVVAGAAVSGYGTLGKSPVPRRFVEMSKKAVDSRLDVLQKSIAYRLSEMLIAHEMTRDQLASRTDIKRDTIRKFETGARLPKIEHLQKIARALEVDPWTLLDVPAPVVEKKRRKRSPKRKRT